MLFNGDKSQYLSWHGLLKLKCLWTAFISVHFKLFHLKKRKENQTWIPPPSIKPSYGQRWVLPAVSVVPQLPHLFLQMFPHSGNANILFHELKILHWLLFPSHLGVVKRRKWKGGSRALTMQSAGSNHYSRSVRPSLQGEMLRWAMFFFLSFFSNLLKSPFHHMRHKQSMLGVWGLVITFFFCLPFTQSIRHSKEVLHMMDWLWDHIVTVLTF